MAALSCLLAYKGSDFRAALAFGSIPLVILIIRVVNLSVLHRKAVRVQGRILAIKKSTDSADKTGWQFSSSTIRYEYSYLQKSFSGIRSVTDDVIASVEIGQYVTVAVDPDAPSKSDILDIYS